MMKRFFLIIIQIVFVASIQACSTSDGANKEIEIESSISEDSSQEEKAQVIEESALEEQFVDDTLFIDSGESEEFELTQSESENIESPIEEDNQRGEAAFVLWDNLLQKYVSNDGRVNYKSFKSDPSFERCLAVFQAMKPNDDWSNNKEKAYWINVYNIFTIKLILDNYPLQSINDIKEPWDKKFIELGNIKYSLNQIENEILRPKFKDARVHFAINCASYSCPPLSNRAYFPESLDKVLTQMTKNFLRDTKRNSISAERVVVSKIFEWYKDDFDNGKGLIPFLNMYSKTIIDQEATVEYMDYSWDLNGK